MSLGKEDKDRQLAAARRAIGMVREALDGHFSIRLWDGSLEPLGRDVVPGLAVRINSPGVLPSLLRRPTLDRVIRHYAHGRIDIEGGTLIDIGAPLSGSGGLRKRLRRIDKLVLAKALWPLLIAKGDHPDSGRAFGAGAEGAGRQEGDNKRFIGFHYDVGNEFYRLFLDPEMQYSCAYYPSWEASLEKAQAAKLEMICRKLRLQPGERFLDIGCGWGGLLCHAVRNHGVRGHGVTLSEEQLIFAREKVARAGLSDRITLELVDYQALEGPYDKIASIGMYEHIGIDNIPAYFRKVQTLLADGGLFLNHAISRGAKRKKKRFAKRPEQRALQKYIFPGGELDDIGHTISEMERAGFEVHDVEGWRAHYEKTTRIWCERLTAEREAAERLVGAATYRIWVAYLGGCSLAFRRGSARIFQTLAGKSAKAPPAVPPSRADLYR